MKKVNNYFIEVKHYIEITESVLDFVRNHEQTNHIDCTRVEAYMLIFQESDNKDFQSHALLSTPTLSQKPSISPKNCKRGNKKNKWQNLKQQIKATSKPSSEQQENDNEKL